MLFTIAQQSVAAATWVVCKVTISVAFPELKDSGARTRNARGRPHVAAAGVLRTGEDESPTYNL